MNEETGTVDPKLLEMLVCPLTMGPLSYDAKAQELISKQAALAYPIRDGIPIMLIDEARPLDDGAGKGADEATGEPPPPASAKHEPGST